MSIYGKQAKKEDLLHFARFCAIFTTAEKGRFMGTMEKLQKNGD
jgi:hypothetical protein